MWREKIRFEWLSFLAALGLMSRIPVSFFIPLHGWNAAHHQRAQIWYPWVGLLLGCILFCLAMVVPDTWSGQLTAALLLIFWVLFTGGLHLDGLADTADAWVGGMGDRDKTLAIMKDPACGSAAVVSLCLCLLLKFVLISELLHGDYLVLLVLAPLAARTWLLPMLMSMPYARRNTAEGMATDISGSSPVLANWVSFAVAHGLILLLFVGQSFWAWLFVCIALVLIFVAIRYSAIQRIGGYSGDILGAAVELFELAFLLAALLIFY